MSVNLPEVISVPIFLFTLPFVLLYAYLGKRVTGNGRKLNVPADRKVAIGVLALGIMFVLIELSLLWRLGSAGDQLFGWLFSWFCGHGLIAAIVFRNCIALWKALIAANRKPPSY